MSETASPVRRGRSLRFAAAFLVLLALIGYVAVQYVTGGGNLRCVVRTAEGDGPSYELSSEMAGNAATIAAVGTTRGMPERAVTIALATALQESALRNIRHGDRDSLGLFQQRPSQGWGTPEQILDPVYSSRKFYEHLAEVPGYSRLPLTVAAQRVQRSGFPQAYAKHEPDAALLAAALTGRASATLSCETKEGGGPGDPARVRTELTLAFGPGVLPKDGDERGRAGDASARQLVLPAQAPKGAEDAADAVGGGRGPEGTGGGPGGEGGKRGWELAHWAVARADELRIEEVSYGGRVWSARESADGWRTADSTEDGPDEVRIRIAR
ncbi:hypothetical protein AB0903_22610 [Streptomyces sp. NPDC048389]|uniref:hypothetical protein n=1 Tax=Streptomyces sp. NPDC048389 TaxID=3154622 RepID=UPI003453FB35